VTLHVDEEQGGPANLADVVSRASADTHFYCCGPESMLTSFAAATATLPVQQIHTETFAAIDAPAIVGGFTVQFARSGLAIEVTPGQSILSALRAALVSVACACLQGVCGSCETGSRRGHSGSSRCGLESAGACRPCDHDDLLFREQVGATDPRLVELQPPGGAGTQVA
jgi:hypothetical protein